MHGLGQNLDSVCEFSVLQASGSGETLFQFRYVFALFLQETLHRVHHSEVPLRKCEGKSLICFNSFLPQEDISACVCCVFIVHCTICVSSERRNQFGFQNSLVTVFKEASGFLLSNLT